MKRVLALCGAAAVIAGCGGSSSPSTSDPAPTVSPASFVKASGCDKGLLPPGYQVDPAHSGTLTAHTYSASADVQAALIYDKLKSGSRTIYLRHPSRATRRTDAVVSCISLSFPDADTLGRFFGSYRTLRHQAKSIVTELPAKPIAGLTAPVAYDETHQSFRGYGIASTNVIEVAGTAGDTLFITSVSGAKPSRTLATNLLKSMVTSS